MPHFHPHCKTLMLALKMNVFHEFSSLIKCKKLGVPGTEAGKIKAVNSFSSLNWMCLLNYFK